MVPPALRAAPFHFVVTASTSAIPDILLYRDQEKKTFSSSINTSKGQISSFSSFQTPIHHRHLLISHLPPSLWTELLYIFQKYTSLDKSFTFSSPGLSFAEEMEEEEGAFDVMQDKEKNKMTESNPYLVGDEKRMQNAICFHVLERREGDFVPNNMVYNTLQQAAFSPFPVRMIDARVNPPPSHSSSSGGGHTMILNSNHYPPSFQPTSEPFFEFLYRLQEGKLEKNEEDFHSIFSSSLGSSSSILQKIEEQEEKRQKKNCSSSTGGGGGESSGVCETSEGRGKDSYFSSLKGTFSETFSLCVPRMGDHSLSGSAEAEECMRHNQRTLKEDFSSASSCSSSSTFFFFPHRIAVEECIPYHSPHFAVLVNLKPIVPYHLLIVPIRCIGSLQGLQEEERVDFGKVMALSIRVLNEVRRRKQQEAWKSRGESVEIDGANQEGSGAVEKNKGRGVPTTTTSSCFRLLDIENYAVAVQQGKEAGQTVAHLHFHLIPFDSNGVLTVTPEAEEEEQRKRPPRTGEMMKEETLMLRSIFEELCRE